MVRLKTHSKMIAYALSLIVIVTIDTNVIFQAFHSRRGASHQIIRLMRTGDITMAISVPVFQEYRDVLSREENQRQLGLDEKAIDTIMQFIAITGRPTNISYIWRPNLRDEGDNMVVELARASGSEYLITQNIRDFRRDADLRNDDLHIVTPAEFMKIWRDTHEA